MLFSDRNFLEMSYIFSVIGFSFKDVILIYDYILLFNESGYKAKYLNFIPITYFVGSQILTIGRLKHQDIHLITLPLHLVQFVCLQSHAAKHFPDHVEIGVYTSHFFIHECTVQPWTAKTITLE